MNILSNSVALIMSITFVCACLIAKAVHMGYKDLLKVQTFVDRLSAKDINWLETIVLKWAHLCWFFLFSASICFVIFILTL